MRLEGANVLLTGGSRGLGPVIARALADRGARVALVARSRDDLDAVRKELEAAGGTAVGVAADVTSASERERLVAEATEALGPIDLLVNNAGWDHVAAFTDLAPEDIVGMFELNVLAPIFLTRQVVPGMVERGRGHVVNMASLSGKGAPPYMTVYASSKHALIGFTHSLRAELRGTGVSASAICPGYVLGAGMFERGWSVDPKPKGATTTVDRVAAAVVKAVERDLPEVVVSGVLGRLADVGLALSAEMYLSTQRRSGAVRTLREEAAARKRSDHDA